MAQSIKTSRLSSVQLQLLRPGMRVMAAVSGGADSVALFRVLAEAGKAAGIVLSVGHVHHGIRGAEADGDAEFVQDLAAKFGAEFHLLKEDVPARAAQRQETIEEAARNTRYEFFAKCMREGLVDAVATAHTLDDQAETVLLKLLRGAWTEGLSGIHPVVKLEAGQILRPLLSVRRSEIEAYLRQLGQEWREDCTNQELIYTRNRVRHELLPSLASFNPQIAVQLSALAEIARDEELYWQSQIGALLPHILLPGKPVRGGGRAAGSGELGVALEVERIRSMDMALQRRVLRAAVQRAGGTLDFYHTEALLQLALTGSSGQKLSLPGNLMAERTPRELRILPEEKSAEILPEYILPIPGEVVAEAFGVKLLASGPSSSSIILVRAWKPGDRVTLRYSRGPKKMKEVLERMRVPASERASWPVAVYEGKVIWMRGVEVEPEPGIQIAAAEIE